MFRRTDAVNAALRSRSCSFRVAQALLGVAAMLSAAQAQEACGEPAAVCFEELPGGFALIRDGNPATVLVDAAADPAVLRVAESFAADLERLAGAPATLRREAGDVDGDVVVIGVLGRSAVVDGLVRSGAIDAGDIEGEWEAYRQIVIDNPFPNVSRALIIVGSDRRGVVFGAYDMSERIGVSPWWWFADAPVQRREDVFITAGARRDQPAVKYRGFFINDEDPAFSSWAQKRFGGVNSRMYEHVFELLLRLKGNYLWPAMWRPKAFADDDPQNMILADAMGVVMGTTHHEPMMRAHDEWARNTDEGVTGGAWDYAVNGENLRAFWRGGVERMMSKGGGEAYESLVTLGMRGDGDEAMTEEAAIPLLERIVADQRWIIEEATGRPARETPQIWALYKEVQDYYDRGMKVPDDVLLLFADDNWGQIRRLPTSDAGRAGGYGVYYHFDYVGGPRNYKWLNTVQIEKTWQQMDLAYARGARDLWIVNVGDIKPVEFPLSFFMRHAWSPEAMTLDAMTRYPEDWARSIFGSKQARAIGELLTRYSQYAARRKPELIDADSFPLGDSADGKLRGGEFGAMVDEWLALKRDMEAVRARLPKAQRDAYFQLVEHPILALSNLYQLYYAVAWNRRLAAANDPRANAFADQAEVFFRRDREIADAYHAVSGGKWDGMMTQTHIGYTSWQQPDRDVMPSVARVPENAKRNAAAEKPARAREDVIAIEAPNFSKAFEGEGLAWRVIPNLGRTLGAVAAFPQGRGPTTQEDGVRLDYDVVLKKSGDATVRLYMVPTLDTTGDAGVRIGVSIDDGPMRTLIDRLEPSPTDTVRQAQRDWEKAVEDNARILETTFADVPAGELVLKIWRLDDNAVLQKVVVSDGPPPPSYLGPAATR